MILSKKSKLRPATPLILIAWSKLEAPLKRTNKRTFSKFQISKSFQLWYPISDAITNEICHAKHDETIRFCFFAEKRSFRYAI